MANGTIMILSAYGFIIVLVIGYAIFDEIDYQNRKERLKYKGPHYEHAFQCRACNGSGENWRDKIFNCPICEGTGVVKYKNDNCEIHEKFRLSRSKLLKKRLDSWIWTRELNQKEVK